MFSEMTYFNAAHETVPDMLRFIDKWGGPETYLHMAAGWAVMFDTPFTWTKQAASDHGGPQVGTAIHWPKGIKAKGELRTQSHHIIDVAPTILEAAGLPEPHRVNGVKQRPLDGVSMVYMFDDAKAKDRRVTRYFEMFGNRAIYHEGWLARTSHKAPWESGPRRPPDDDSAWELYDTRNDFSLVHNLAAEHSNKLKDFQTLFLKEAESSFALPIDDRACERIIAEIVGRLDLTAGRTSITLAEGMTGMSENVFLNVKNKSKTITAEIEVPEGVVAHGAIIVQGGRSGGWDCTYTTVCPRMTTISRASRDTPLRRRKRSGPEGRRSGSSSPMMAEDRARAERERSSSTTRRSEQDESATPSPRSFRPMKPRTWASTLPLPSSRSSGPSGHPDSPDTYLSLSSR